MSGSYSAEDGTNSGAQIKVISKTGSNRVHGSAFFKYDEPGLNAFNTFGGFQGNFDRAPNVRVDNKVRNYGGSIGGPIVKDKLFFFFAYEGEHVFNQAFGIDYVETPQFIQAVTAANPNSIASTILAAPGNTPRVVAVLTPVVQRREPPGRRLCSSPRGAGSGFSISSRIGAWKSISRPQLQSWGCADWCWP